MDILFDADILVFRCAFAAEYRMWYIKIADVEYEFRYKKEALAKLDELLPGKYSRTEGEDYQIWSEVQLEPLSHAIQNIDTLVGHILDNLGGTEFDVRMFLSPYQGHNFRSDIAKTLPYKGNRDRAHRPTYEKELRNYIIETWDTVVAVDEEADDLLGIEQTKLNPNCVIVSLDKDLDQISGLHHNFMYDRTYSVSNDEAIKSFHIQLMTGDTTDNIPGLSGIGPGKANKALHGINNPIEQLKEVWRMYQIHSGKDDPWKYLLEQGQLLHIRRQVGEIWEVAEQELEENVWDNQNLTLY